jgi:hypothetical protein
MTCSGDAVVVARTDASIYREAGARARVLASDSHRTSGTGRRFQGLCRSSGDSASVPKPCAEVRILPGARNLRVAGCAESTRSNACCRMCTCRHGLDVFAAPKTLTVTTFSTLMTTECRTGTAQHSRSAATQHMTFDATKCFSAPRSQHARRRVISRSSISRPTARILQCQPVAECNTPAGRASVGTPSSWVSSPWASV